MHRALRNWHLTSRVHQGRGRVRENLPKSQLEVAGLLEGKVRNEETDDVKLMLKVEKIFWREILGHNMMMMMSWWNFKWLTKTRQMEWQQRRREWHSSWVISRYAPRHNHEKENP